DDKDGDSEPFYELPSGFYGDVTLFAVWGLPDDYIAANNVTSSLSLKDNVDTITYDTKSSITLIGEAKDDGGAMTSPKVTYYWEQGGKDKSSNTTGQLSVKTVADSGTYTYDYRLQDSNEPLWMYYNSHDGSEAITINKGVLSIKTFTLETKPYFGREWSDVKFSVTVENSANVPVTLSSFKWTSTMGVVPNEKTISKEITVYPTDTANYETSYALTPETFSSETLYLTFVFPEITQTLRTELEYGNNYGGKQIIYEFNKVYLDALATKPEFADIGDSGRAPHLADADEIGTDPFNPIYRGAPIVEDSSGKALYNNTHPNVTEEFNIYVYFNAVSYTVEFDAASASNTTVLPEPTSYGYGKFVIKPDDPTNGDYLFVGWFFTDTEGEYRAWRFNSVTEDDGTVIPQDRVTGNVTLTARWLYATDLDSVTFTINPTSKFTAQGKIDSGEYLTVTAKYKGEEGEITVYSEKEIAYGGYEIQYGYLDGNGEFVKGMDAFTLVNGDAYIRVGVRFGSTTVYSEAKYVNVEPIDISEKTDIFNFGETNFEYDGSPKSVKYYSDADVKAMTGGQITGIEYVYTDKFTGKVVESPTEIGSYLVTVNYTTASPDFYAKPTTLEMEIATTIKVRVEWTTNTLMYSGSGQHPKIAKIYNVDTGAEVAVNESMIVYTGDTEATGINIPSLKRYKVTVSLGATYTVVEGEECVFDIVKALLEIPVYTSGTILYDGTTKVLEEYLGEAYNPLLMEITTGGTGREVDTYRAIISLKDTLNCSWSDGTTSSKQVEWKIEPAQLIVSWDKWEFVSDGESTFAPKISGLFGLASGDSFDYESDFVYKLYDEEGNLMDVSEVGEVGSYKIVASFNGSVKNYALDSTSKEWYFVVVPKSGMTILTIEWGEKQFLYDGGVHYPTFTIKDSNGRDVTEEVSSMLKFSDNYRKEKELGTYTVKVTLSASAAEEYFIRSGQTCTYKIVDENGYAPDEE
ncbi:MAG: InlB B-repeat-containing protein, partial [Clostridia bacterium]|nr:InlB B-repeat-containing protein [Clostridia bacterium]